MESGCSVMLLGDSLTGGSAIGKSLMVRSGGEEGRCSTRMPNIMVTNALSLVNQDDSDLDDTTIPTTVSETSRLIIAESDDDDANTTQITPQENEAEGVESVGRIQVRVPQSINSSKDDLVTTEDSEILSADNSSTQKKPLKVMTLPSLKKGGSVDGIIQPHKTVPNFKECLQCNKKTDCTLELELSGSKYYLCSIKCQVENRFAQKTSLQRASVRPADSNVHVLSRVCGQCKQTISASDNTLSWETMDFCNEDCLKLYQNKLGMQCSQCKQRCQEQSVGKYCVRFGCDIKQFCHSSCLEEYKKGIRVCSFCQDNIPDGEGIVATVNDRNQMKEFCSEDCMEGYDKMSRSAPVRLRAASCDVCNKTRIVSVEVNKQEKCFALCSDICFNAFKFVHPNPMGFCDMCRKHFITEDLEELLYTFADDSVVTFCSKKCMNAFVIFKRKIVQCNWCKVKKYNFDMIKKTFSSNRQVMMLCSFHCFNMWKQSPKRNTCDHCKTFGTIMYHLGMSDGTLRSFCGHECLMKFQQQFNKIPVTPSLARPLEPVSTGYSTSTPPAIRPNLITVKNPNPPPKKNESSTRATICAPASIISDNTATIPVISSVTSLEGTPEAVISSPSNDTAPLSIALNTSKTVTPQRKSVGLILNKGQLTQVANSQQTVVKQQLLLVPPQPVTMCNKSTYFSSHPTTKSKGISCKPYSIAQSTQTEYECISEEEMEEGNGDSQDGDVLEGLNTRSKKKKLVLKRVKEVPVPVPLLLPVPIYVPVPIPVCTNVLPTPLPIPMPLTVPLFIPTPQNSAESILEYIQALRDRFSNSIDEAKALENGPSSFNHVHFTSKTTSSKENYLTIEEEAEEAIEGTGNHRKRRRTEIGAHEEKDTIEGGEEHFSGNKRQRVEEKDEDNHSRGEGSRGAASGGGGDANGGSGGGEGTPPPGEQSRLPSSQPPSPSSSKSIRTRLGVQAWKKWVKDKNKELQERGEEQFGTEMLWLSPDQLALSLSLFVSEFKKPSGQPLPPDVIFYLLLAIQIYLTENGREDDIFMDAVYETFSDALDNIIVKAPQMPESRLEEEHLWQSLQLGASSPFILLFSMLYFTTKAFEITKVDSHLGLAFSQLIRGLRKNDKMTGADKNSQNRLRTLCYYPPSSSHSKGDTSKDGSDTKKKNELVENFMNPERCPVKLFTYYLGKCPESMRNRSDVFYLEPEKPYLPDSPYWFTTRPLSKNILSKMFNKLYLIKETSQLLGSPNQRHNSTT